MTTTDIELDMIGQRCPMPLLKAKQALVSMQLGQVLKVAATDPGSVRDFAAYCQLSGHTLLSSNLVDGVYYHRIKKTS
ncbi:sulfurtransferase TusA family protein [Zooshikella harenae]|uniref:Sulfurtransferase TusA family protein n=1 Tax=Zooshikella harenae TaxID=2827238 RepID=A0ABS5Z8E2_9GAMM|nr:sulfurtransferase TusA family protein [Zooshikella harenae]MBU2710312.1 sulfurtransferase TusA family protein [Zooshikella harenae]